MSCIRYLPERPEIEYKERTKKEARLAMKKRKELKTWPANKWGDKPDTPPLYILNGIGYW